MTKPARTFLCALILASMLCLASNAETEASGSFTLCNGSKVHYTTSGKGEPAVVFIHGWSCNETFWRFQRASLAALPMKMIYMDLPGHGKSEQPQTAYTHDLFADAVLAVLDDTNASKAVLVGHSMGFSVALRFARKYPSRCAGLCSVDGVYFRLPKEEEARAQWHAGMNAFVAGFKGENRDAHMEQFLAPLFIAQTPAPLRAEIEDVMKSTPPHVANSAMEGLFDEILWVETPLKIPFLAIYAHNSDLPDDHEAYLKLVFPQVESHLWPNVGHFLMMERPEPFNTLLSGFLMKHFGNQKVTP